MRRKSNIQIIKEFKEKHSKRYDYQDVKYINRNQKVKIHCKIHGPFYQSPSHHLKGHGCKKCATESVHIKQRKTTEEFIKEANKIYNNKFDYSKTIYKTQKDKVTIICPIHGEFNQLPRSHIRNTGTSNNYGCRKCGIEERAKNKFISDEDLIKSFRKIHSYEYDYSKIDYKGNHKKIEIYCKKCKKYFSQIPSVHKRGGRCKFCLAKEGKYNFKLTQEEWIKRAKKKHHSKYDYSKVVYRGGHEKVIIICKKINQTIKTSCCNTNYKSNFCIN